MNEKLFHNVPENAAVPAENVGIAAEINGSTVFGRVLLPALDDPNKRTPIVLFLHGFPGTEQNRDLAQLLRTTGLACAHFSYRGVWGSKGYYSFTHLIEDAMAMAEYLRGRAEELRIDPERLYLVGHSMGGFTSVNSIAEGLRVKGAFIMAPGDLGNMYFNEPEHFTIIEKRQKAGYFTLESEDALQNDVVANAEKWYFPNAVKRMPYLPRFYFVGGTRDTTTPPEKNILPILECLRARGADVQYLELNEPHAFCGSRLRLAEEAAKFIWETENEK
ncbi:MAG: alpha/beta fold hydrolase [Oscillospiraceae bacterium]|nr:alpha/beta fold hydrolase [Oscillospiraceae bacterium]